jgi:hypothetical protein
MGLRRLGLIKISTMIFILCLCSIVKADEFEDKYIFFLGTVAAYNTISGDFNGHNTVFNLRGTTANAGNVIPITILPSIDSAPAYGFVGGVNNGNVSFEFSYITSYHNAATIFNGSSYKRTANYSIISLDGKYYLNSDSAFQPFAQFGIAFPWLKLNQHSEYVSTALYNTMMRFYGLGLDLGGGIAYTILPIRITLSVYLRSLLFTDIVSGASDNSEYFPYGGLDVIPSVSVVYVF